MITSKELNALGIPNDKRIMPLAMKLVNTALAKGTDGEAMRNALRTLCKSPSSMLDDSVLGPLAQIMEEYFSGGALFTPRETPAPWRQWGDVNVEDSAIRQMENACSLPSAVCGALMPDAHTGYGLPIGGILAVKDIVIPYAVGVDIACRMRLTVIDMPVSALFSRREELIYALERETRFGVGASFERDQRREHPVIDEDWTIAKVIKANKDKAWKQLGSSGGGNHFVEFGELHLETPADLGGSLLEKGVYLAILSHSGSRGTGETVADHYSKLAMSLCPALPQEIKHLAWLDLASEAGQEYWAAMQLMGKYAAANHEMIHQHVLANLGAKALTHVENHHNFAWKEEYNGETVIVHRKGATPAGTGVLGIVPGSMGSPGFVVRGKGNRDALNSCSHGAGRLMSRTKALSVLSMDEYRAEMKDVFSTSVHRNTLDESPMAYKSMEEILSHIRPTADVVERIRTAYNFKAGE